MLAIMDKRHTDIDSIKGMDLSTGMMNIEKKCPRKIIKQGIFY